MDILYRLRKAKGKVDINHMTDDELATYKRFEQALKGRKLTDDDVKVFFDQEFSDIITKLPTCLDGSRLDTFLKVKLEFLTKVKQFLAVPDIEKKQAEMEINSLINEN